MNAFLLMIPLFVIRFGLLRMVNKEALGRAAFFAPLEGGEKTAYMIYEISNIIIILFPVFLHINTGSSLFFAGLAIYISGIAILIISTIAFAKPDRSGINTDGIYKISRNPMYIGYFIYYAGCAVLTRSLLYFVFVLIFQVSAHWIILSEERWCIGRFGKEYENYMKRVRRYL